MTPERLEELKAILDKDGYFVTDDIRELITEVERLSKALSKAIHCVVECDCETKGDGDIEWFINREETP